MKPIQTQQRRPYVLIATPCHSGEMKVSHHVATMNILLSGSFPGSQEYIPSKSGIATARNHCFWFAKKHNFRYMFFSDSDTMPQPWHLKRLIDRNVPVVGGLYSHKSRDLRWCLNTKPVADDSEEFMQIIMEDGPLKGCMPVSTVGTGAMLIDMDKVLPELAKLDHHDQVLPLVYREDQESEGADGSSPPKGEMIDCYFQERPVYYKRWKTFRKLTEDWFFCHICDKAGIPIYADCTFHVPHRGEIDYPLEKPEMEGNEEVKTDMKAE